MMYELYFSIGGYDSIFIEVFEMLNEIYDNDDDDYDIKEHSLKKKYVFIENNELFNCIVSRINVKIISIFELCSCASSIAIISFLLPIPLFCNSKTTLYEPNPLIVVRPSFQKSP